MQRITPCLWFENNAEQAVKLYTSVFKNSKIGAISHYDEASSKASGQKVGSVLTIEFTLEGQQFMILNGGSYYKFSPAVSLFVGCKNAKEVDALYKKLSKDGIVMMELNEYPFSKKYAWFNDKYGVSWQLFVGETKQKIMPCLMFVGEQHGKAEAAMKFYTSIFKNSSIDFVAKYEKGEDKPGVKHAQFTLDKQGFVAMDSGYDHKFNFNQGISFVINCETQAEVDHYWNAFKKGGQEVQCGWITDKYGIPWQVVPTMMSKIFSGKDKEKAKRVMAAMLEMVKLDIKKLEDA